MWSVDSDYGYCIECTGGLYLEQAESNATIEEYVEKIMNNV